nr:MAG TPA: hypothetical protein [Caudoviricetes sp.]
MVSPFQKVTTGNADMIIAYFSCIYISFVIKYRTCLGKN